MSGDELLALRAENRSLLAQVAEQTRAAQEWRDAHDVVVAQHAALRQRIEQMRRRIYGASSERHDPGQQRLDLGMPIEIAETTTSDSDGSVVPAEATAAATVASTGTAAAAASPTDAPAAKRSRAGRHPGRRALPADAEVIVEEITVPESQRLDAAGVPLPVLSYRVTDKWDYRPGTYLIRRYRRAIYGRPFSDAQDRVIAAAPPCLVPQGKMTDAALIHTVVDKFADHLPLYRQEQRALRTGFRLSRSTLVSHVTAVAEACRPIVEAMGARIRRAAFVHLDDTPVKLLDPGRGQTATARIWIYRSADEAVFQFTPTREGRHPAEFLGKYRGFIVADAYAGHERLYRDGGATAVGCWAHVRRKFYDIRDEEPFAVRVLDDIADLYRVEDDIRLLDADAERVRVRRSRSRPRIAALRHRLDQARATVLPASALGRAIAYACSRWDALTPYCDHGFLPIDNNPAENALRPWAVGRKNWLFLGSSAAGERAAIVATLIENCRMQHIDPFAYLIDTAAALQRGCTDFAALTPRVRALASDRAAG